MLPSVQRSLGFVYVPNWYYFPDKVIEDKLCTDSIQYFCLRRRYSFSHIVTWFKMFSKNITKYENIAFIYIRISPKLRIY